MKTIIQGQESTRRGPLKVQIGKEEEKENEDEDEEEDVLVLVVAVY